MSRVSIRVRVTAVFAVTMAAVLASTGLFLYSRLHGQLTQAIDRELRLRAQDLGAFVGRPGGSLARESRGRLIEHGESYAQLVTPRGRVLDWSRPLGRAPILSRSQLEAALRGPVYVEQSRVPGLDEPSRALATTIRPLGRARVLLVGTTTQDRAETLASFRDELLIAGPLALLLASGLGYLLAGMALKQVERMRRRAAFISAATPAERLPVPRTGDELERLGRTLNEMLDRLQAAIERERALVADAGHELRTPLAVLRTELELALRQTDSLPALRDAIRHASGETARLCQLAEDLLVIARSDGGELALRTEQLRAADVFGAVISRVEWRAQAEGKRLLAHSELDCSFEGDRIRLEQALGNLVENAVRYGGDEIRLVAVGSNGHVELHVRDNGTGFPEGFLQRAFERFARADTARSGGGAGLGLSIAQTIAAAHGGSAHAANATPAGADVWIELPLRRDR